MVEHNKRREVLNIRDTMVIDQDESMKARDEKIELAVKNGIPFVEINIGARDRALFAKKKLQNK